MIHEELLAQIDHMWGDDFDYVIEQNRKALRAVVELHQPYQHEVVSYVFCKGCTIDLDLAPPYPCETIQAIEKELE